jgi:D-alanyl-D-alanine dipeptidase
MARLVGAAASSRSRGVTAIIAVAALWAGAQLDHAAGQYAQAPPARTTAKLPEPLVYLRDIDPSVVQDMRYAGQDNFTGAPVPGYDASECILTRRTAEALATVQRHLAGRGLSLKVYDCFRPVRAVAAFMRWAGSGGRCSDRTIPSSPSAQPTRYARLHRFALGALTRSHRRSDLGGDTEPRGADLRARANLRRLYRQH